MIALGCAAKPDESGEFSTQPGTSASGSEGDGEDSGGGGTTAPASESGAAADTGAADTGAAEESGAGMFIMMPDGGGTNECDVWAQDCPPGEKCMPWANDGGSSWNSLRCTPLDENPKQPGDTCLVEGSDVTGIDDCALGSMCFAVDPETNMGLCVPFCEGSPAEPTCSNPDQACNISNNGVLVLCLEVCDPLLQNCPTDPWNHGCYPVNEDFLCWPDYSFDLGAFGDPCEFFNVCDAGLFCAIPEAVPGCAGSSGCCSSFCDMTMPEPCPASAQGQECLPWFLEGQAPPGYENVGFCGVMM
jgi:hypothetical protein